MWKKIILFVFRKHQLNCHRMKPALFQVLCEVKEKTGKIILLVVVTRVTYVEIILYYKSNYVYNATSFIYN